MEQILPVKDFIESYWLCQRHELSKLRSTPDLPAECDIIIIGAGMAGVTTLYHFLKESDSIPSVVLLEARELCSGATGRNGGHSKVKVPGLASLLPELGVEFVDEYQAYVYNVIDGLKKIVEEEELDCEFELRRSFDVLLDERESKQVKEIFDQNCKEGRDWTKIASWYDQARVEQVTSVKNASSAFSVPACSLWPYKFVTQLLARLVSRYPHKLNVQTTTPVTAVTTEESGVNVIATPRGAIKSKKLILATNAYTAGLLPQYKDVIVPVRGMASHLVPEKPVHPHLSNTYNIRFGPEIGEDYFNPRPDGSIVVGGGKWLYSSDRPSWYNNFNDAVHFAPKVESYWKGYMQRNFLGWEESGASVDKVWVGIMGYTSDGWPHIGRVPGRENQWILAGFNGAGMTMILTAAKGIAKMVREDLGFEDVKKEYKLPNVFATSIERLRQATSEDEMTSRK